MKQSLYEFQASDTLRSRIAALNLAPGKLYIDGEWQDWHGPRFDQIHPTDNIVVQSYPEAGAEGVDLAVRAARRAFDEGPWPRMPAQDRKKILQKIVDAIERHAQELDVLQSIDNGTPYHIGRHSRMSAVSTAEVFDHYAGWCDKITGETYPQFSSASNMSYFTVREPVGVVAAILAWNAPLRMFALKVAPALASGCCIVVKPSECTNAAATRLAEILADCGLPEGVFNFLTGEGATGAALVAHAGIDKISFTGSAAIGAKIGAVAAAKMKRVSLELGGKSAGIIFPEEETARKAATLMMSLCSSFMSGQVCSTPSRALVHRAVYDEFLEIAAQQVKSVRFGDPFDPATTSAPMITRKHHAAVSNFIEIGKEDGASLLFGGEKPGGDLAQGNWITPALFADVRNDMRIAREEIFGPVLAAIPFDTEEEAIRLANDSDYGLAGVVFTSDINRAFRVTRAIKTGQIGINGYASVANAPMGGVKMSGVGREGGWPTIEAYTELKTININHGF